MVRDYGHYDPDGYWAYIGWAAEDARQRRETPIPLIRLDVWGAAGLARAGLKACSPLPPRPAHGSPQKVCGCRNRDVAVYTSTVGGKVNYVGITNNIERRAGEHIATKGIVIARVPGLTSLSRADARAVEQVLINDNGGLVVSS